MNFKSQSFFVFGLSRSGKSVALYLLNRGAKVYIYDDFNDDYVNKTKDDLITNGAIEVKKDDVTKMYEIADILVISPGIPIDNPIAVSFKRNKRAIMGESEIASRVIKTPIIGVTGTNGKTTTVTMIEEVLKNSGLKVHSCGNIGTPMISYAKEDLDVLVAEISSFQLETLNSFLPHIAIILNITEDHMNRHYNMSNYIFLKSKILKNITESEYVVLNYDDEIVRNIGENSKGQIKYISIRNRVNGGYYDNGSLYYNDEKIIDEIELKIEGNHNLYNVLATIVSGKIMGLSNETIRDSLINFKGIAHRIQLIDEIDGVKYINDSKGTNIDATFKAIDCMKNPTVLLLGGKDKGYNYHKLFERIKESKVRHCILYGENRFKLLESAISSNYNNISLCEKFEIAVKMSKLIAKNGENVLLSPACASFDEFESYEERGEKFISIVENMKIVGEIEYDKDKEEKEFKDNSSNGDNCISSNNEEE